MRHLITIFVYMLASMMPICLSSQVTERERPEEWNSLVNGSRYVDRFMPMQKGKLSGKVWGAPGVVPRYIDNGIEKDDISFWGGNILQDSHGTFHMYVCGWPESAPKGHMEWPNSTVFHATARKLQGPYNIVDTIGPGHNPEAYILEDGRIVVYVIDAYYLGQGFNGPWEKKMFDFDSRDRRIIEGLSNITFARRQDGSRLAVCRGGGIWISRDGLDTYRQITEKRIYPSVDGEFEDPVVWRDSLQYHLIVNDWLGRIAYYQRSLDGVHWITEAGEAYVPGISRHEDGTVEDWYKYERAKVFQDSEGRAIQMNFAVVDTIKWEDLGNDNHSSKNICLPLRKDLILEVLNREPITDSTARIELRIYSESGLDPISQLDVKSLRLGSHTEVNYGRGAIPISWRTDGNDLIVTFDGNGSGITEEEFAPKLLGIDKSGNPVTGYARLPYVNYRPAILSARRPTYDTKSDSWQVEVENFGLSISEETKLRIISDGEILAETFVPPIRSYGNSIVSAATRKRINGDATIEVHFLQQGREVGATVFE